MSYYVTNENSVLNINNAHLKVSGNVMTDVMKLGAIEFAPPASNVAGTVNFTNVTTGVTTSSNLSVGGTLSLGTVEVVATTHTLANTTANGNVTPHTVQFSNATTGFVATGNVEVGGELTVSGNVSDLNVVSNVNMLHTSNTASIKLNSNVVTEFPRSKKLIKYPRVALTGSTSGGYTASANAEESDVRAVWKLFDNTGNATAWRSDANGDYNASGAYTGSANLGTDSGGTAFADADKGDWVKIQLPHKIKLDHFTLQVRNSPSIPGGSSISYGRSEFIKNGRVWGSNDGTSWSVVHTISGTSASSDTAINSYTVTSSIYYRYFGLVITDTNATVTGLGTSLSEIELYGLPEYDPEAYGTDVMVKSVPNVPNTDWLEVYYDAKNYTSGVVQDLSTNSFDGTLTNGASFNNSDGIDKFVFDGSDDYISGSIPSTFTGNQTYTFSIWVKPDSHPSSGFVGVFEVGTRSTDDAMGLYFDTGKIIHLAYADNLATTTYATIGEWVHITGTYTSGDRRVYANGVLLGQDTYSDLTLVGTTFKLGSNLAGTQAFDGSIANFRLFNRALTPDEIYQLYAYQKEYFGHGDLSMTLKAGRLGIGTSEPRAALDVRGDVNVEGLVNNVGMHWYITHPTGGNVVYTPTGGNWFSSTASNTIFGTVLRTENNAPVSAWNSSNGYFTAPEDGLYHIDLGLFINGFDTGRWGGFQLLEADGTLKERQYTFYTANLAADDTVGYSKTVYMKTGESFAFYTTQGTVTLFLTSVHTTMNIYKIS